MAATASDCDAFMVRFLSAPVVCLGPERIDAQHNDVRTAGSCRLPPLGGISVSRTRQLVAVLGKKLTAYVGGLKQARTVDGWIAGARPYGDAEDRVRATYRVASMLTERLPASSVQRWFTGMNPDLGDQVALQLLRHGGIDERRRVLEAAIAYLAQG
jgi:hypothetical protein